MRTRRDDAADRAGGSGSDTRLFPQCLRRWRSKHRIGDRRLLWPDECWDALRRHPRWRPLLPRTLLVGHTGRGQPGSHGAVAPFTRADPQRCLQLSCRTTYANVVTQPEAYSEGGPAGGVFSELSDGVFTITTSRPGALPIEFVRDDQCGPNGTYSYSFTVTTRPQPPAPPQTFLTAWKKADQALASWDIKRARATIAPLLTTLPSSLPQHERIWFDLSDARILSYLGQPNAARAYWRDALQASGPYAGQLPGGDSGLSGIPSRYEPYGPPSDPPIPGSETCSSAASRMASVSPSVLLVSCV